jgi:hypothetical protein
MFALHKINHHLVADGSARDSIVTMDGFWRKGALHGTSMAPLYHPVFSRKSPYDVLKLPKVKPPDGPKPKMTHASSKPALAQLGRAVSQPAHARKPLSDAELFEKWTRTHPKEFVQLLNEVEAGVGPGKWGTIGSMKRVKSAPGDMAAMGQTF